MRGKYQKLKHSQYRPILSDTLPFEVPPCFSNRHLYKFISENKICQKEGNITWVSPISKDISDAVCILFGIDPQRVQQTPHPKLPNKIQYTAQLHGAKNWTSPFFFKIHHKKHNSRVLAVAHPRNQLNIASFLDAFSDTIIFCTGKSPFSIRRPVSVSRISYHADKTHLDRLSMSKETVEEKTREYEQMGSFFRYEDYSNVYKFYESYKYHNCEKKFNRLLRLDISKCFESIYTHTLPWAVRGKEATKTFLSESKKTFGGKFDAHMQHLNRGETNGIIIGPEFSRIFAEIILQSADVLVEKELREQSISLRNKVDYEAFRYVDDYFVFFDDDQTAKAFIETLSNTLREYKLHLNEAKTHVYEKPLITELTIAKNRISRLISNDIIAEIEEISQQEDEKDASPPLKKAVIKARANDLIVKFKTILKESNVAYSDIVNYTYSVLERKIEDAILRYNKSDIETRKREEFARTINEIIEFLFFLYAQTPRVNHTIRLCRMLSRITETIDRLQLGVELKQQILKHIADNTIQQIQRNGINQNREVETLYLLISLSTLGKEHWLDNDTLRKYLSIKKCPQTNSLYREKPLSYFSIVVGLLYMKNKKRYDDIRSFLEEEIVRKILDRQSTCKDDAEIFMLFLDAITCPYIAGRTKVRARKAFGITAPQFRKIREASSLWFTEWETFNFGKELDAKRAREVY